MIANEATTPESILLKIGSSGGRVVKSGSSRDQESCNFGPTHKVDRSAQTPGPGPAGSAPFTNFQRASKSRVILEPNLFASSYA